MDLGRDTRTSTQSRRLVRRDAGWSLNWPSEANFVTHKPFLECLCVYCMLVFLGIWKSAN